MYELYRKRDFAVPVSKLHTLSQRRDITALNGEPPKDALFWKMWNANIDIAGKVLNTGYFTGIRNGNLNPVAFGSLMVLDAYYCMKGRDDYSAAATHAPDETCREFCMGKVESYDDYNQYYHRTWHIREADSVIPENEIKEYADHEAFVAGNLDTPYLLCAMLPCEYLWTWIANQLDPDVPESSLYRFWVDGNAGTPEGAYQMGNLLESYRREIDEKQAMDIYAKSMNCELSVFTAATIISVKNMYNSKR
jgi:thiaminase/transcriptional activator TenA